MPKPFYPQFGYLKFDVFVRSRNFLIFVIPAKAGIQSSKFKQFWTPASAGVTVFIFFTFDIALI